MGRVALLFMKKSEINEIIQEDLSYYSELLKKYKDRLNKYQKNMGNKLDDLYKKSDDYYKKLLEDGFSEYDAGLETSAIFDSSFEDVYATENEILANIKYAEIRFKIARLAYANIKYMSDDSEV